VYLNKLAGLTIQNPGLPKLMNRDRIHVAHNWACCWTTTLWGCPFSAMLIEAAISEQKKFFVLLGNFSHSSSFILMK
jgi:hypothetical protein